MKEMKRRALIKKYNMSLRSDGNIRLDEEQRKNGDCPVHDYNCTDKKPYCYYGVTKQRCKECWEAYYQGNLYLKSESNS